MKKNAVGRVLMHREPLDKRVSSWHLPMRLLCLVLALIIWLAVTNLGSASEEAAGEQETTSEQTV